MASANIGNGSGFLYAAHGTSGTYTNLKVLSSVVNNAAGVRAMANLATSYFEIAGASTWNASADKHIRFFLNTGGSEGDLTDAVEISDFIVSRGLNSRIETIGTTINASDALILTDAVGGSQTIVRKGAIQVYEINATNSGGNDDLDTITITDVQDNDIVIIRNATEDTVTITENGNITLEGDSNFTMDTQYEDCIALMYRGAAWYELWRLPNSSINIKSMRLAGIPQEKEGVESYTILAGSGTVATALKPGLHSGKVYISGSCTLSAAYALSINSADTDLGTNGQGAQSGDTFTFIYNATVTVSSYSVTIAGITLTAQEALLGGVLIIATFDGTAWRTVKVADTGKSAAIDSAYIKDDAITEAKIVDGAVSAAKLEGTLKTTLTQGIRYLSDSTTTASSRTTALDLATYTLPASTLTTNKQKLVLKARGSFGATANAKTLKLYFDDTVIMQNTVTTSPNNKDWWIEIDIVRTDTNAVAAVGTMLVGTAVERLIRTNVTSKALTSAYVIKVEGTPGTSSENDTISCDYFSIDLVGVIS